MVPRRGASTGMPSSVVTSDDVEDLGLVHDARRRDGRAAIAGR